MTRRSSRLATGGTRSSSAAVAVAVVAVEAGATAVQLLQAALHAAVHPARYGAPDSVALSSRPDAVGAHVLLLDTWMWFSSSILIETFCIVSFCLCSPNFESRFLLLLFVVFSPSLSSSCPDASTWLRGP